MFASLSRFRRQIAVLTALAMVASVLAAAPAAAADDPMPDYTATFDACGMTPGSGFTDVPSGHANAGDIDCIAYYGITKGTSATTYSPLMSVTREQMALFLTRLAALTGIEVASNPADPGFMDTGDLAMESQTAIAQLADLGITKGTSMTTYSPLDTVTRGQMAQFISRLMNLMTPQSDGDIALSSTTQYGYRPSDVDDNDMDVDIGSPFTDLGAATKDAFDAITNLYELGVAAGISDTSYAPSTAITRASMAGFMAAVLDHSNARPAGLSIQATPGSGWGDLAATVMVSVRDDSFMPVEDQAVDVFSTISAGGGLRKDGTCNFGTNPDDVNFGDFIDGDCMWNDNDDPTDVDGNLILEDSVLQGTTRLFYAWIGSEDGDQFDADDAEEATASVTAMKIQTAVKISSTINEHADEGYDMEQGQKVDLRDVSEVTFTAQLIDQDGDPVMRAGIGVRVEYRQGAEGVGEPRDDRDYVNSHEAELETDDDGQVSFTVYGPADNTRIDGQTRPDDVVFAADGLPPVEEDVYWVEEAPVLTSTRVEVPVYVLAGSSSAIRATVYLYDQYGNPHQSHRAQKAVITIGDSNDADNSSIRPVISRGYASWRHSLATMAGMPEDIAYDVRMLARNSDGIAVQDYQVKDTNLDDNNTTYDDGKVITNDGDNDTVPQYDADNNALSKPGSGQHYKDILNDDATDLFDSRANMVSKDSDVNMDDPDGVEVVSKAVSTNVNLDVTITHALMGEFLADNDDDGGADLVYSYNSDDIFIDSTGDEGVEITMGSFASKIKDGGNTVEVVAYDVDGTSIFRLVNG